MKEKKKMIQQYMESQEERQKLYKRSLWIVLLSQIFGGAGLAAGITVGALLAQDMLGTESFAGVPAALFTLGSALAAYLVGRLTQRLGRRHGLTFGFISGGVGAIGVIVAANMNSVLLLFISLFVYGAGTATNLMARYAGTDLASEKQRAKSVSIAMVATTFGAVAGPNLVTPMGEVAKAIGMHPLAGPFILAAVAYLLAGLTIFLFMRPDPLIIARALAAYEVKQKHTESVESIPAQKVSRVGIFAGAMLLVLSQVVMVAVMTMTPVHMQNHGGGLTAIGMVIGLHIAAMYLPSLATGALVDRIGRNAMAVATAITLAISGVLAAFVPGDSFIGLTIALILLGLGWNFGVISGTSIIIDSTTIHHRAKTQGSIDVWVALGGSFGSVVSGVIVAYSSYAMLGFIGTSVALMLIPIVYWARLKQKRREESTLSA
ncbi:MFS transporter [Virgibacillus chiguensis]|uniref:Predicted arabinose efflux permease, MFS family n=1 Tax=Virgibacillus chiguensis TaxID=411959 RepID=A0A1M5T6M9_9BACI|nr:MFS transporter [Virgibacillus chiguensis]SHH46348.1 Predicted arabinose efflux permease, MFS family [Virgibacillus chiguensis]